MPEPELDPRPLDVRLDHWHYGCWQRKFLWEERVAMSELGIGPDEVHQNGERRVSFVTLRGRVISDEVLAHLAAFEFLATVDLVGSTVTDACVDHLKKLPRLKWLWIAHTQITEDAARMLEKAKPDLFVFRKGEGAIRGPFGEWMKINKEWWSKKGKKRWWQFW